MKLEDAIRNVVNSFGVDLLLDLKIINVLNDFNALTDISPSKFVLKSIISEGYMANLISAHKNHLDIQTSLDKCIYELYEKCGFRKDVSNLVMNAIIKGLGYEGVNLADDNDILEDSNIIEINNNVEPETSYVKTGEHLLFRDVEINGTIKDVCSQLTKIGYSNPVILDGGSALVNGDFAGVPNCDILVIRSRYEDFVWKIAVLMPENNNWYSLKSEYERFKSMFTKKYGKPDSYEYFSEPYEEGDGYEHTALSVGKCSYISFYNHPLGHITLRISENGALNISYEDKINAERNSSDIDNIASDEI